MTIFKDQLPDPDSALIRIRNTGDQSMINSTWKLQYKTRQVQGSDKTPYPAQDVH